MDRRLRTLELRLEELGVDDLTIGAFIGRYNSVDDDERSRMRAMGDRRLLRLVAELPAAEHSRAAASYEEDVSQHADLVARGAGVAATLRWVGDSPARASIVWNFEKQTGEPRPTLVAAVESLIGKRL